MRRVMWFGLGVAVTVVVVLKAKEIYTKATPKGVQQQVAATTEKAGTRLAEFFDTLTTASAEREAELREALGLDDEPATVA